MSNGQKIFTTSLWAILVIVTVALIASGTGLLRRAPEASPAHAKMTSVGQLPAWFVPEFSLTDQEGRTVRAADFKGKVWVAAFIFTRCPGPCPMMTSKMASLQRSIPDARVKLVSFTMDPQYDTPAILKSYGQKFDADFNRWSFLSGERSRIVEVAQGLKLPSQVGQSPADIIHSDRFVLIGPDGRVRGYFTGTEEQEMSRLSGEATKLASEGAATP